MNHVALFSVAFLFCAVFASKAEADRSRFFGVPWLSGGKGIDRVYDLPDTEPFLRNGEAYDLGYLNGDNGGYVLYRGERYSKLSDTDIARLKTVLGFDPTTKDRMERAAWRRDAPWTLAVVIVVSIIGIFVLLHKAIQIARYITGLATVSAATASKARDGEPLTPLKARKKKLARRYWRDEPVNPVSPVRGKDVAAEDATLPNRSATSARAFGRRNT